MPTSVNSPRSFNRVVTDSILAYFYPVTRLFHSNMRIERIYYVKNGYRDSTSVAYHFSGKIASYNQGAIIEYVFMLAERHKSLRLSIEKKSDVEESKTLLLKEMNAGFFAAVSENFNLLHEHFLSRSKLSPHISIRGHWKTERKDTIITLFRDRDIGGDSAFDMNQSTAITHCARTGEPYLCNDIARALIDTDYRSPRFRSNEAKSELSRRHFPLRRSYLEKNWENFWVSAEDDSTVAYRSNLTIPIMIDSRRLSKETIEKFHAGSSEKLIFGYLCLDHYKEDFFDDKIDIPIAKMIADILSIFSFQRLRFVDFSNTFRTADGESLQSEAEKIKAFTDDLVKSLQSVTKLKTSIKLKDRKIEEGIALVNADEMMLHLAEATPFFIENTQEADSQDNETAQVA